MTWQRSASNRPSVLRTAHCRASLARGKCCARLIATPVWRGGIRIATELNELVPVLLLCRVRQGLAE